jgi:hypothetical protein
MREVVETSRVQLIACDFVRWLGYRYPLNTLTHVSEAYHRLSYTLQSQVLKTAFFPDETTNLALGLYVTVYY